MDDKVGRISPGITGLKGLESVVQSHLAVSHQRHPSASDAGANTASHLYSPPGWSDGVHFPQVCRQHQTRGENLPTHSGGHVCYLEEPPKARKMDWLHQKQM